MTLTPKAQKLLEDRYCQPGEKTWDDVCRRVAAFASDSLDEEEVFYQEFVNKRIIPASPILMNAGIKSPSMFSCFVLPIDDTIVHEDGKVSIFEFMEKAAQIFKHSGGVGADWSRLRPAGSPLSGGGRSTGPISFIRVADAMVEAVRHGGCVSHDTRISTPRGLIPMISLVNARPGKDTDISIQVGSRGGVTTAYKSIDNGESNTLAISSALGYNVNCTSNHLIPVVGDALDIVWKPAGDICVGDVLLISRGRCMVPDDSYCNLPSINTDLLHSNSNPVPTVPSTLDEDLAFLIGVFIADGCISIDYKGDANRISISVEDRDDSTIGSELDRILTSYGLNVSGRMHFRSDKPDKSYSMCASSRLFAEWWINCGFDKDGSKNARIPELIFKSPESVIHSFLRGLFSGDGYVSNGYPGISSTSLQLIKDTQLLLNHIGIISSVSVISEDTRKQCASFGDSAMYVLRICGNNDICKFAADVGFVQDYRAIDTTIGNRSEILYGVNTHLLAYIDNIDSLPPSVRKEIRRYVRGDRNISRDKLEEFVSLGYVNCEIMECESIAYNVVHSKVKSIANDRTYTVDISTANAEYVANGIVVHNKKKGAMIAILKDNHPDAKDFVRMKYKEGDFRNLNASVMLSDEFMQNPDEELLDLIVDGMYKNGEPGVLFHGNINRSNQFKAIGDLDSTNPCLTGDMEIFTDRGYLPIVDCVGKITRIWNGAGSWSDVIPYQTSDDAEIWEVSIRNDKNVIRCTPDHKFIINDENGNRVVKPLRNCALGDEIFPYSIPATNGEPGSNDWDTDKPFWHGNFKITRITKNVSHDPTYCLTEPINHTMIVNGVMTGQCGEEPLHPFESCVLANINWYAFVKFQQDGTPWFDTREFSKTVQIATLFLDKLIDKNYYPLPEIEAATKYTRKISHYPSGVADTLAALGIVYGTVEAMNFCRNTFQLQNDVAWQMSIRMGAEYGVCPAIADGKSNDIPTNARNGAVTCAAPAGSTSLFANHWAGIEPYAYLVYDRTDAGAAESNWNMPYELVRQLLKAGVACVDDVGTYYSEHGKLPDYVPQHIRDVFVTALDITPEQHIIMQAVFQECTTQSCSKTVILPNSATKDDIKRIIKFAYDQNLKGFTVYRDGSRDEIVYKKSGSATSAAVPVSPLPSPLPPDVYPALRFKSASGCGTLYNIVVFGDQNTPFEVFSFTNNGGCPANMEAICRVTSKGLQEGLNIDTICKQLSKVKCTTAMRGYEKPGDAKSCSHAIGRDIMRASDIGSPWAITSGVTSGVTPTPEVDPWVCEKCGAKMSPDSGCKTCMVCGNSRCG